MEILSDPMNLPSTFWDYSTRKWLRDAPVFPISQVFGFTQFTVMAAPPVVTSEATSSTAYVDLATVGPTLTGVPDGNYLIAYGALMQNSVSGAGSAMSIQVNGTTAADADWAQTQTNVLVSVMRLTTKALSNNGSSTITAKYRAGSNTATFRDRWMIALKYSNL